MLHAYCPGYTQIMRTKSFIDLRQFVVGSVQNADDIGTKIHNIRLIYFAMDMPSCDLKKA